MKGILPALLVLALIAQLGGMWLGFVSRRMDSPARNGGTLAPCESAGNCVCSEGAKGAASYVMPLALKGQDPRKTWRRLGEAVSREGGVIQTAEESYLAATFRSSWFGFVDDLEARLDTTRKVIHLRSASRVGKSDLGANRKRVEALRKLVQGE